MGMTSLHRRDPTENFAGPAVPRDGIEPPTRGFSILPGSPGTVERTADFDGERRVFVDQQSAAIELLRAVADGRESDAAALAYRLAAEVLAAPTVTLAIGVRDGGPLAIARAVLLAEHVVGATPVAAANAPPVLGAYRRKV